MSHIYSITNLTNNKQYVGKTSKPNPYDRWKQHVQLAKSLTNLNENNSAHSMTILKAMNKYGIQNFKFRVIEECKDDIVNERETYWITKLDTYNNGYNCTLGGEGIKKKPKDWNRHPHSKPVSCYTLEGEWVCDYETSGVAANTLGDYKAKGTINACIKGITFQAMGYRWAYKGEKPKDIIRRVNRRFGVYGYNLETGEYKEWKNQADCCEELSGDRKNNCSVNLSLKSPVNNKLTAYGWYLFYDNQEHKVKLGEFKIAQRNTFSSESARKAAAISNAKKKRAVIAIEVNNPDNVLRFNSISEASFFIKGEGDYSATGNINHRLNRAGDGWISCYGYRWRYA